MPTEFQQIMDTTLAGIANTFAFLDEILIVNRGEQNDHLEKVRQVLRRLDEANVSLGAENAHSRQNKPNGWATSCHKKESSL